MLGPQLPPKCSHQPSLRHNVAFHRFFQISFGRAGLQRKLGIERIEFEEVTMRAAWRAGTTVPNLLEVVRALQASAWKYFSRRRVFDQANLVSRQIVEHPMHPRARGRIRIVADDRDCLCRFWHAAPFQRRRDVNAIASVLLRNRLAFIEGRAGHLESRLFVLRCCRGVLFNWLWRGWGGAKQRKAERKPKTSESSFHVGVLIF